MSTAYLGALMVLQLFPGSLHYPNTNKSIIQLSSSETLATVERSLSPIGSAILAGSTGSGYHYVCWYKTSNKWYRVYFYRYGHIYARAVEYNGRFHIWDIHNGRLAIDKTYTRDVAYNVDFWDIITADMLDIDNNVGRSIPVNFFLPKCNEHPISSLQQFLDDSNSKNAEKQKQYLNTFSYFDPNIASLIFTGSDKNSWPFGRLNYSFSIGINMKSRYVDSLKVRFYNTNLKFDKYLAEKLIYIKKNVSVPEKIFSQPNSPDM